MPNILEDLVQFIFLAIQASVPIFVLFLLSKPLFRGITKKFKWKWLSSSLLTTYIISLALILLLYFTPLLSAVSSSSSYLPPDIQSQLPSTQSVQDNLSLYLGSVLRGLILALFFTILCLPFEFLGLALKDYFSTKKWNPWVIDFGAVLVTVGVVIGIVFLMPWLPLSLIYLLWFAG